MKQECKIISKGLYKESDFEDEILSVKQYVFVRENNKKYLMLRFLNNANFLINSFEFWIVQKNVDGTEIAETKVRIKDIYARPGETFSPEKCFLVKDKCTDFEIRFVVIKSGHYEYRFKNGEVFVRYPLETNWIYGDNDKNYTHQESKLNKKVRFTSLILWIAVLMIFVAMIWPLISDVLLPAVFEALESK